MGIEASYAYFTASEKEQFQRACRRLLKSTFVVREKDEDNKKIYFFVSKNAEAISDYFSYIGFDIVIDRDCGVAMLKSCSDLTESSSVRTNHLRLKKSDSMVLCCLWTLYVDRVSTGSLARSIIVSIADIRYELEKYGFDKQIDKSLMAGSLTLLSRYNLVDINGKLGEADCSIKLLPSLQFALDAASFEAYVKSVVERMQQKGGGFESDDEDSDDTDA